MHGLAEFLEKGGIFMYINLICSAAVVANIIERIIFLLFKSQLNSKGLLDQLRKLVQANNVDRAIRLCGSGNAPLLRVAKAGLVQVHRGEEAVSSAIEESLVDALPDLKKRISSLWSLANIATLLGLLGTVTGLIRAFAAVAFAAPEERSAKLAEGISEAMNNTAMGLGIAVTCIVAHLMLNTVSKTMATDLESFSMKLENFLVGHARTGASAAPSGEARAAAPR
ncbi:MAG: MotA/TolQ/ExbB proton channel family protein [Myxococcota bacterium]